MAKKESKLGLILVIFIAFIMISSVFGIIFSGYNQNSNSVRYNNIKFIKEQTMISARINEQKLYFDFFPQDVESIELNPDIINLLTNKPEIDITSNEDDIYAEEIALAQYNIPYALKNLYIRVGFTTNNSFDMPIITCQGATPNVPVLLFKKSNQTKITLNNSCVIAEASRNTDILAIKDRIVYSMLGVLG